ncbi:MAG: hypothetical protein IIW81_03600, partial [Oscillospiraceae bacterium]|nr:hypothetical protein [Oscillospiraceae bacterium]
MYIKMIKRRLLSVIAALVFLLALSGCGAAEKEGSVYMNINAEKAKEMMDGLEKFVLLDAIPMLEEYWFDNKDKVEEWSEKLKKAI